MSVIAARNNYTGLGGGKRMNCAQSVASAFKDRFGVEDSVVENARAFGGGNAPGGLCGAYYIAKTVVEKQRKGKEIELEKYFLEHAGALECSKIKGIRKLSCVGCIEKCSEFLENNG